MAINKSESDKIKDAADTIKILADSIADIKNPSVDLPVLDKQVVSGLDELLKFHNEQKEALNIDTGENKKTNTLLGDILENLTKSQQTQEKAYQESVERREEDARNRKDDREAKASDFKHFGDRETKKEDDDKKDTFLSKLAKTFDDSGLFKLGKGAFKAVGAVNQLRNIPLSEFGGIASSFRKRSIAKEERNLTADEYKIEREEDPLRRKALVERARERADKIAEAKAKETMLGRAINDPRNFGKKGFGFGDRISDEDRRRYTQIDADTQRKGLYGGIDKLINIAPKLEIQDRMAGLFNKGIRTDSRDEGKSLTQKVKDMFRFGKENKDEDNVLQEKMAAFRGGTPSTLAQYISGIYWQLKGDEEEKNNKKEKEKSTSSSLGTIGMVAATALGSIATAVAAVKEAVKADKTVTDVRERTKKLPDQKFLSDEQFQEANPDMPTRADVWTLGLDSMFRNTGKSLRNMFKSDKEIEREELFLQEAKDVSMMRSFKERMEQSEEGSEEYNSAKKVYERFRGQLSDDQIRRHPTQIKLQRKDGLFSEMGYYNDKGKWVGGSQAFRDEMENRKLRERMKEEYVDEDSQISTERHQGIFGKGKPTSSQLMSEMKQRMYMAEHGKLAMAEDSTGFVDGSGVMLHQKTIEAITKSFFDASAFNASEVNKGTSAAMTGGTYTGNARTDYVTNK